MSSVRVAVFPTAIGPVGIAWSGGEVVGSQLPESDERATLAKLERRFPGAEVAAPTRVVARAIAAIQRLLAEGTAPLDEVPLAYEGVPPFHRKVYEASRALGPGETISYGALAERIGHPGAARAVGQALGKNPFAIIVPCHRVLAAGGRLGGFSAHGGVHTKKRMLAIEQEALAPRAKLPKASAPETKMPNASAPESKMPKASAPEASAPNVSAKNDGAAPRATKKSRGGIVLGRGFGIAERALAAADGELGRWIRDLGPARMEQKTTASVFVALAESIVYQQLHGKAAATIFGRLVAAMPKGELSATALDAASDEVLRGAGLSQNKLRALRDLATRSIAGDVPELDVLATHDDEAIIARLSSLRGIGRWTVEMILMFRLARPDVLPIDDYGVRKGLGVLLGIEGLPEKQVLRARGASWAPHRSVASWYLWRIAESAVAKAKPSAKAAVAKKPLAKQAVAKKPIAKQAVAKKPVAKAAAAKKPIAKQAAAKKR